MYATVGHFLFLSELRSCVKVPTKLTVSVDVKQHSTNLFFFEAVPLVEFIYNTIQLYCLCVEKFAFWLVIYIKTFNKKNIDNSTKHGAKNRSNTRKILNNNNVHTHARTHAPPPPPTHPPTHSVCMCVCDTVCVCGGGGRGGRHVQAAVRACVDCYC